MLLDQLRSDYAGLGDGGLWNKAFVSERALIQAKCCNANLG